MRVAILRTLAVGLTALMTLVFVVVAGAPVSEADSGTGWTGFTGTDANGTHYCDGSTVTINGQSVTLPAHNNTTWHGLVARDSNSNIICTYGHEHGIDPSMLDSVFGHNVSSITGQQISYPWYTTNSQGIAENDTANKHRSYKWVGEAGLEQYCASNYNKAPDGSGRMISAFRMEEHADGNMGHTTRFHSYFVEATTVECSSTGVVTNSSGSISFGGHNDFAPLTVDLTPVALTGDPTVGCIVGNGRGETGTTSSSANNSVWYGSTTRAVRSGYVQSDCDNPTGTTEAVVLTSNITVNQFGYVDLSNVGILNLFTNWQAHHDHAFVALDSLNIRLSNFSTHTPVTPDVNGYVTWSGIVDRHGHLTSAQCSPHSPDCIPLTITNVHTGVYGCGCDQGSTPSTYSYDGEVLGPSGQHGYYVTAGN